MTIKDLAEMLTEQGYDIKLRKRSDGGYIISRINGVSYKGATGNIQARRIVGAELSHARQYQLARIRPPKKIAPMQRKQTTIPEDLKKELRKVQRAWRKKHPDISGTISMRGLRYQYEHYGEEMARASLNKSYRYSQGLAYIDNVQTLIARIEQDYNKADEYEKPFIEKAINEIRNKILSFKEDWISECYDVLYDFEKGAIIGSEFYYRIHEIITM